MREIIDLNGYWDWQLPGGAWQRKWVPSSYTCVGRATFQKDVAIQMAAGQRAFLCFDGIAYTGRVWLNGQALGDLLPYIPYRFEVTGRVVDGPNRIRVEVEDITASYGPTGGWEDYGGITRDVYLEVCDAIEIEDVQWLCSFNGDYTAAQCQVHVSLDGLTPGVEARVSMTLAHNQHTVHQDQQAIRPDDPSATVTFAFGVDHPLLWSPDSPALYDLRVTLEAGGLRDENTIHIGFRELKAVGSRFYLNGQEIFLKGVARHEMWGDHQGFTLTRDQIEQDMRLIKNLGANFVRLVHYPHSKATIDICDRLGLMVTEEPGLWWSDLANEAITSKALKVMEHTIRRDRNNASVVAWLLFNECPFPGMPEYLARGKALCNELDPSRLVSAANCLDPAEAKRIFDQTGMDFYTFHPYAYEPNLMAQGLGTFRGKPCVFTEWGGWLIMDNTNLMRWFKQAIVEYAHNRDPKPNLAGMSWWQWQDVFQFSRGLPGCINGTLTDGLVDKDRNKKPMYAVMADYFAAIDNPAPPAFRLEPCGQLIAADETHAVIAVDITGRQQSGQQAAAWEEALNGAKVYHAGEQSPHPKHVGPLIAQPIETLGSLRTKLSGRPLILAGDCRRVEIQCGFAARRLYFLGQTTFFDGYPVRGHLGEVAARYVLHYRDGSSQAIDLRNGYEMASASLIARTSRIDPVAANVRRACVLHLDEDWEVYQIGCLEVNANPEQVIDVIEFTRVSDDFQPLLYGISAIV